MKTWRIQKEEDKSFIQLSKYLITTIPSPSTPAISPAEPWYRPSDSVPSWLQLPEIRDCEEGVGEESGSSFRMISYQPAQ